MNISDNVIFSTTTTITIFILGFVIREWVLSYSKNKELAHTNKYIEWQLKTLKESLKKQIEGYESLLTNIPNEEYRNLTKIPSLKPEIIINKDETLHRILFKRKKGKQRNKETLYYSLTDLCHLINAININSDLEFDKLNNQVLQLEMKLDKIGTDLFQEITFINTKKNKDVTEKKIIIIHNNFKKAKERNRNIIYSELTNKIENIIIEDSYKNISKILPLTSNYYKEYIYYQETLTQFYSKFLEYKLELLIAHKELNYLIKNYTEMKLKGNLRWW